tara:strand:- start:10 stop:579 length:570 start_codon:yes stop_codon:yes gene_type:complete
MPSTNEFRNGLKLEIEGDPFSIIEFQHVKPGKGGAFVRTKLKNLKNGRVIDRTFRSGESVGSPSLEEKSMQFLYREGDIFNFMDTNTFEQIGLERSQLGETDNLLKEETIVNILFYNAEPITVELPTFVELLISKTEPGFKGDTATGGSKIAELESGAVVNVPLFVNQGDLLKIDTRTGEYVERVKSAS